MSEQQQRKPYVLRDGASHWIKDADGNPMIAPAGHVLELTDAGAHALRDRVDPLEVVQARARLALAAAEIAEEQLEAPPAPDAPAEDPPAAEEPAEELPIADPNEMKAAEAVKFIRALSDQESVRRVATLEGKGKNRGSVIKAAKKRFDELAG
jgi:hypothetical protein